MASGIFLQDWKKQNDVFVRKRSNCLRRKKRRSLNLFRLLFRNPKLIRTMAEQKQFIPQTFCSHPSACHLTVVFSRLNSKGFADEYAAIDTEGPSKWKSIDWLHIEERIAGGRRTSPRLVEKVVAFIFFTHHVIFRELSSISNASTWVVRFQRNCNESKVSPIDCRECFDGYLGDLEYSYSKQ